MSDTPLHKDRLLRSVRFLGADNEVAPGSKVTFEEGSELIMESIPLSGFCAVIKTITATTYILLEADAGKVLRFTSGSAITVSLPGDLSVGWSAALLQRGAGQITLDTIGSATLLHEEDHTKTAQQHASVGLLVQANSNGTSAEYHLSGSTAV